MEECELCGRKTEDIYVISIEGTEMRACVNCAKGNKVVRKELAADRAKASPKRASTSAPRVSSDEEAQIIMGYGKAIKDARERMQLPLKVLAEMINEKEHFLSRVEEEQTLPTITLTKKLEKALKIKLTE
ncbi:MAG: TIGR00270 family protein [Candidatus Micrarchaeota archaeon]|nr:TIGR00270 family protein [Candidatus Micrarchaeota archaeon]